MTSAASEDTHRDLVSSSGASALKLIKNFAGADLVSDSPRLKLPGSAVEPERARTQQTETLGSVQLACGNNRRSSWQLLGQHDFRLYFLGSLTSNLGTWLQSTAQVLIAYQVTHSVFTVGLIASAQFAGMVVVSPWAPVLADRVSPIAVLIGAQFASAAIAASMAWRYLDGMLGVHSLIFGALGLGFAYSLGLPIQTALVPKLVREEADVTNAVKMNSVSYNAGRALAPALCVLVITCIGPDLIFILNAISFVIFAILLCRLKHITDDTSLRPIFAGRLGRVMNHASKTSVKAPLGHPRARVTDGLMIALRHRRILLLLAIVAAVTLADDPILVLRPALAHSKLHITSEGAGYFIAALGWGSVLGSLPPTLTKDDSADDSARRHPGTLRFGCLCSACRLSCSRWDSRSRLVSPQLLWRVPPGCSPGPPPRQLCSGTRRRPPQTLQPSPALRHCGQSPGPARSHSPPCSTAGLPATLTSYSPASCSPRLP